jgi:hypothetical protein
VLALHVATQEFLGLITADVEFSGDTLENLAFAYHEMYRKKSPQSRLASFTYEQLSDEDKDKNRSTVRGIPHKLASIGYMYDMQPSVSANVSETLADADAEKLARLEHDRWLVDAIDNGYIYGQTRDDISFPHKHPDLVPWDDLDGYDSSLRYPESIASKLGHGPLKNTVDIELAKQIPEIMRSAGYYVYKL